MTTSINNVANGIYKVLSSAYKVQIYDIDGYRVFDYDDARNFYCIPEKIMVTLLEKENRNIINVQLNKNNNISNFEKKAGMRLRKLASRNTNTSYNIRSYGKEITPKEESVMNIENVQEGMYGTTRSSYQKVGECKVIIRHSSRVNEEKHGSRSRHISSMFVETKNGERFKIAENNLHGARAMARHLSNGGSPFDTVGIKVTTMMSEMNELKGMILEARKISKKIALTEENNTLVEQMRNKFLTIRESLKRMSGKVGYLRASTSLTESAYPGYYASYVEDDSMPDHTRNVGVDFVYNNETKEVTIPKVYDLHSNKPLIISPDDELRIKWEIKQQQVKNSISETEIKENRMSTDLHNDDGSLKYVVYFEYTIDNHYDGKNKPDININSAEIQYDKNDPSKEGTDILSKLSDEDLNVLKNDALQFEVNNYNNDKEYYGEDIISEYKLNSAEPDLSNSWDDKNAWGNAVLTYVNRNAKITGSKATALQQLNLDPATHAEFINFMSKNQTNENINTAPMQYTTPLARLARIMADALEHPEKYDLQGAFSPLPVSGEPMTKLMNARFNRMSKVIYKLQHDDSLTPDEHKLALKFYKRLKNNRPGHSANSKLKTNVNTINNEDINITNIKIEDDAKEQVQDMADFSRDKQKKGNYADTDDLFSIDEVKENAILEAWFTEASRVCFSNEEELMLEDNSVPSIKHTLPLSALHQLNLHIGNPLFKKLIIMYESQGIMDNVFDLVEDNSKLKTAINLHRIKLCELHVMDNIVTAYKLVNDLISKNQMGSKDAIDIAAKKYAKKYHNNDELAYEQASEALRQMASEKGIIHADDGRTFADDVMSHSDQIKKDKEEIESEQFYGDAHFETMDEMNENFDIISEKDKLTKLQFKKRAEIVKAMKKDKTKLKSRYGNKWESVMYAIATKKILDGRVNEIEENCFELKNNNCTADDKEELDKNADGPYTGENIVNITRIQELAGICNDDAIDDNSLNEYKKNDNNDNNDKVCHKPKQSNKQRYCEMRSKKEQVRLNALDDYPENNNKFNERVIELSKYKI